MYRVTQLSEVKWSKREADCSPTFNEEVMGEVSYARIPLHVFRDECKQIKALTMKNKSITSFHLLLSWTRVFQFGTFSLCISF